MNAFTYEEQELMSICDSGIREGLIANLEKMRGYPRRGRADGTDGQRLGEAAGHQRRGV